MTHALKTWPEYFKLVKAGTKTFELRKDDRPFGMGDDILLQEYDPQAKQYTGEELTFTIGFVFRDASCFGLKKGYCIISLKEKPDYA